MVAWQAATGVFFTYVALVTVFMPRLDPAKRRLGLAGAAAGLLVAAGATLARHPLLDDWVLPLLSLLLAYWTSGLLFVAPMPRAERALLEIDRALRIRPIAGAAPRAIAEFLEIAYFAVYPIIPIALMVYLTSTGAPDATRFWTVTLLTDYICFGMLPWIQTRPPRALESDAPWQASFRAVNLQLLGKTSIQVNTFPSGHAAEALASALLVTGADTAIVAGMFIMAMAISAGAVFGRYHYAADAFAGWIVAFVVWLLTM